jgi:uncharacterized membrane protein YagU involved in acid resistance
MHRFWKGALWGAVATLAMSILMIIGLATGVAPMPKPIPAAIVGQLTGGGLPKPVLMATAALLHLGYGAFWGGLLVAAVGRVTVWLGLALGVGLWLLMQVVVLPFLGWGAFGAGVTPKIALATLVLHLVYGGTLGVLAGRASAAAVRTSPGAA